MFDHREANEELTRTVMPGRAAVQEESGQRSAVSGQPVDQRQRRLSDAAGDFYAGLKDRGLSAASLREYRQMLWSVIEFVGCDTPIRELSDDMLSQYLAWLRKTPSRPWKRGSLPTEITPATVAEFFVHPGPRHAAGNPIGEVTVSKKITYAKAFIRSLRKPTALTRRERPSTNIPGALVPRKKDVEAWWHEYLSGASGDATVRERQHVVYQQAFILLTGLRLEEALSASLEDMEGHWLLIRISKVPPRIIYVSGLAMGIARLLRDRYCERLLFPLSDTTPLCGWRYTTHHWHDLVRACGKVPHAPKKPQQALRCMMSDYLYRKDPVGEAAQLGHGKVGAAQLERQSGNGVVFRNYLDQLRYVPRYLEPVRLPSIEGISWPEPIRASRDRPGRLNEALRWLLTHRCG